MKKILFLLVSCWQFSLFAQSFDTLMFRSEVLERLERIEEEISSSNLPRIQVNKPNFRSVGYLKNNEGFVEVDVANLRSDYTGIVTGTMRFNYGDERRLSNENKKYKFIEIHSVFLCEEYDAGIQPTALIWQDAKGSQVKTNYGKIKRVEYKELDSQFMSAYKFVCRKK